MILLQLFWTFFIIGIFTFGGGYAVMSLIQSEIVMGRGWITETTFTDITAIAQITPGPIGLNCATYVGYEIAGIPGAALSSFAVVLPSFLIMLIVVRCYQKYNNTLIFGGIMNVLKPVVAGLIGAAAVCLIWDVSPDGIRIIAENFPDIRSWGVFAIAFLVYYFTKAGPIITLAGAALLGLIIYL